MMMMYEKMTDMEEDGGGEKKKKNCFEFFFGGGSGGGAGGKKEEKISLTMKRTKESIKSLHLKVIQIGKKIEVLEGEGKTFLQKGDEERAEACAAVLLQMNEKRTLYIQIWLKHKMLLEELDKVLTLSACADSLKQSSGVLGNIISNNLNIADIDKIMASLEMQQQDTQEASKALTQQKRKKTDDILHSWKNVSVSPPPSPVLTTVLVDEKGGGEEEKMKKKEKEEAF
jgi:hypothetical protein